MLLFFGRVREVLLSDVNKKQREQGKIFLYTHSLTHTQKKSTDPVLVVIFPKGSSSTFSIKQKGGQQVGTHFLQDGAEGAEGTRPLGGQSVQEDLGAPLAALLRQDLLVLAQGEHLEVHQVGQHGAHVQLAQDLLPVLLEDPGLPSLPLPGEGPAAAPLMLLLLLMLLPLLPPDEPAPGAAAKHLQLEERHQNFFHGSVNAISDVWKAHSSRRGNHHAA